jgi:dipeptidyl aminopeptidase/acylaminoacyl peptidase
MRVEALRYTRVACVCLLALTATLALPPLVQAMQASHAADQPRRMVVHGTSVGMHVDIYPTLQQGPVDTVILLHGWHQPDDLPLQTMAPYAAGFQGAGLRVIVPALRGWMPTGGQDDCAGEQVDDIMNLLDWIDSQQLFSIGRIFLVGYSQGGQIALLSNARGAAVDATVVYAPVTDLAEWRATTDTSGIHDYLHGECGGEPGWAVRDVIANKDGIRGPLLMIHGSHDQRVPASQSLRLHQVLISNQQHVDLQLVNNSTHAIEQILEVERAIQFFNQLPDQESGTRAPH